MKEPEMLIIKYFRFLGEKIVYVNIFSTRVCRRLRSLEEIIMKKILVCGPFDSRQQEKMRNFAGDNSLIFMDKAEVTSDIVKKVNVVIGNIPIDVLRENRKLEWVQLTSSGADVYAKPDVLGKDTILTCATGAYGVGIAEYMVMMLLTMMKKLPEYLDNQRNGLWNDEGMVLSPMGKRVLIVGTGDIGIEFAKRMRPFGCKLIGIRRRCGVCPDEIDEIHAISELETEVSKADVIALCLPGTKQTYHLFDERLMKLCKKGAFLMNVGRGNAIDTGALQKKEVYERFAGIWLDVCEQEPLPDGHALFSVPNILITPHITGGFHLDVTIERIFEICMENLKAWQGKIPYRSVVDREQGYSN